MRIPGSQDDTDRGFLSSGELRYNLIVDALVGIIHKKPKEGGISAVGGTGSVYTYYGPEEAKFSSLTNNFLNKDCAACIALPQVSKGTHF